MQDEKWQDIIGRIKDDFEVFKHETVDLEEGQGDKEYIIFSGPAGKMKLERTTRPLVLDKRAIGSRRIGSQTTVEYIYSDTEKTNTVKVFNWNDNQDDWVEVEMGGSFKL